MVSIKAIFLCAFVALNHAEEAASEKDPAMEDLVNKLMGHLNGNGDEELGKQNMDKFVDKLMTKMQAKLEEHAKMYNEQDNTEHDTMMKDMMDKLFDKSLLEQHLNADGTEAKPEETDKMLKEMMDKLFGQQLNADGTEATPDDMHQKLKEMTDKLFDRSLLEQHLNNTDLDSATLAKLEQAKQLHDGKEPKAEDMHKMMKEMMDKLFDKSLLEQHLNADGKETTTDDMHQKLKDMTDKLFGKQLNADGTEATPEDMHQKLKEMTDKLFDRSALEQHLNSTNMDETTQLKQQKVLEAHNQMQEHFKNNPQFQEMMAKMPSMDQQQDGQMPDMDKLLEQMMPELSKYKDLPGLADLSAMKDLPQEQQTILQAAAAGAAVGLMAASEIASLMDLPEQAASTEQAQQQAQAASNLQAAAYDFNGVNPEYQDSQEPTYENIDLDAEPASTASPMALVITCMLGLTAGAAITVAALRFSKKDGLDAAKQPFLVQA